jgi:hypothetical protein
MRTMRTALLLLVPSAACMPGQWVGYGSSGYGGGGDEPSWDIWRLDPDDATIDAAR